MKRASRWQLNRAGIINVYQYENETIAFAGGRLLLRGVNGSGKTTAMNMLLPFLLTARQQRIDAAGEQSGVLKSWMLSGNDDAQPAGYLWLEFARAAGDDATPEYLAIGCGIKANRASDTVTTWWFVTDRRPGVDLALVEHGVAITADVLRTEVGADSVFAHDRRRDYRARVAHDLYGGGDIDQFLTLLNTVRNPRVGDRIDLDLPEHLVGSLPRLSDHSLIEAARPLDDLDQYRRDVADLRATVTHLDAIADIHHDYLRAVAGDLVERCSTVDEALDSASKSERRATKIAKRAAKTERQTEGHIDELDHEARRRREEIRALEALPAYQRGTELDDLRGHVASLEAEQAQLNTTAEALGERLATRAVEVARAGEATDEEHGRVVDSLAELAEATAAVRLARRPPASPAIGRRQLGHDVAGPADTPDFARIDAEVGEVAGAALLRTADIDQVRGCLDRCDVTEQTLRHAEQAHRLADQAVTAAVELLSTRRDELARAVSTWHLTADDWAARTAEFAAKIRDLDPVESPNTSRPVDTADTSLEADPAVAIDLADDGEAAAVEARRRSLQIGFGPAVDSARRRLASAQVELRAASAVVDQAQVAVDELAASTEPDPPIAPWQHRSNPSLGELVDFADHLADSDRAGLEAALEASGLLAAEVRATGLELAAGDLVLGPGDAGADQGGQPSLATELVITPPGEDSGVDVGLIRAVLATIAVTDHLDSAPGTDASPRDAVTLAGGFRIGPLSGAHSKPVAEFIGATARRATLERMRAEAAEQLEVATIAAGEGAAQVESRHSSLARAEALLSELPGIDQVVVADRLSVEAQGGLDQARERLDQADQHLRTCDDDHATATNETARVARSLQLPDDRPGLSRVEQSLDDIAVQADRCHDRLRSLGRAHSGWQACVERWTQTSSDLDTATSRLADKDAEHRRVATRLATLDAAIGASFAEVSASLEQARAALGQAEQALPIARRDHTTASKRQQKAQDDLDNARRERESCERAVASAVDHATATLQVPGVTAMLTRDQDSDPSIPAAARDAHGLGEIIAWLEPLAVEPARSGLSADSVRQSVRQRQDSLGGGWDAEARQPDPSLPVSVTVTGPLGTDLSLSEAIAAVGARLAQNEALLTHKQDAALRELLHGVVAQEVAEKLFRATRLIQAMNERLEPITSAHGIGVSLRWRRSPDLDPATSRVADLLAKLPDLRTPDEDRELSEAMAERLEDARRGRPEDSYRTLIAEVLDYRRWFEMAIMVRRTGDQPRRLSRRTQLSEGEKKLITYQPLFAAVAASCDSLADSATYAPRFVLLDDAFAKVSEDNHAKLFGLLVDLDLDFIATSERLWGTHSEVPALAITEVVRDAEAGVILLEHANWNGRELESRVA